MPKNKNQRLKLLYLKQILEEYTDADHGITMDRILELLSMRGVKAERKSVYDDIDTLINDLGMDIQKPSGRDFTYRLNSRTFDVAELKLIIDSIQSSKFLSVKSSRHIIKNLSTLCSRHEASQLHRDIILANRVKNSEDLISNNVGNITAAIFAGEQISYKYFDYNIHKKKAYRKNGVLYQASPYALIYTDENYYMLAYTDEHKQVRPYRVDRMEKVKKKDGVAREGKDYFDKIDLAQYQKYTFSMFSDNVMPVTMVFHNRLMNAVIDRFGREVMAMKEDDSHFRITASVAVSPQFYGWVFGLGNLARIIGPEHVRQGMKEMLESVHGRYEDIEKEV